jgi:hypothetical protein
MPYFLVFNTGMAVTSAAISLFGDQFGISIAPNIALSCLGGIAAVAGFSFWANR